jgi:hypothetical protein
VLPNDNILITGSAWRVQYHSATVEYNVTANTWTQPVAGLTDLYDSAALRLGNRVLIFPYSGAGPVQEYHYANRTISKCTAQAYSQYSPPLVTAVPESWFAGMQGGCKGIF